jgi:hypothetical protein
MSDARDTQVRGVTLAQFALMRAGLADGLALDDLLGFVRLDAPAWDAAAQAWDERILDAMEQEDLGILQAVDEATEEARTHWTWRIPPLDADLRAWFDFLQAWLADAEPQAFLSRMRLGPAELAHLHRLWSARLAADANLRAEALGLLGEERREPPVPEPERPRLRKPLVDEAPDDRVTREVTFTREHTLPFGEGEPAPKPPPLAVPLPRRRRAFTTAPGVDGTQPGRPASAEEPLPFSPAEKGDSPPLGAQRGPSVRRRGRSTPAVNAADVAPSTGSAPASAFEAGAEVPSAPVPALVVPLPARRPPDPPTLILRGVLETTLVLAPAALPTEGPAPALDRSAVLPPETATMLLRVEGKPAEEPTGLTMEQHAELTAAMTTTSDPTSLLARYGLTREAKKREDERWAAELQHDPSARAPWMRAFSAARARLLAGDHES